LPGQDPDEALVREAREGSRLAMEELYRRHERRAFNLALRVVNDPWDAADITQDAFIKAFTGLDRFRTQARFGTWLHRIVLNAAYDHLRRRRAQPMDDEALALAAEGERRRAGLQAPAPSTDPLPQPLRAALISLPEAFRLAIVLCDLLGFAYAEAAEILEVREGTIKSRLFRGRALLAADLQRRGYLDAQQRPGNPEDPDTVEVGGRDG
jgi:RNA polymerase sigma-70 factor (ECF subfamily)